MTSYRTHSGGDNTSKRRLQAERTSYSPFTTPIPVQMINGEPHPVNPYHPVSAGRRRPNSGRLSRSVKTQTFESDQSVSQQAPNARLPNRQKPLREIPNQIDRSHVTSGNQFSPVRHTPWRTTSVRRNRMCDTTQHPTVSREMALVESGTGSACPYLPAYLPTHPSQL